MRYGDLMKDNGSMKDWHDIQSTRVSNRCWIAFGKLISNLGVPSYPKENRAKIVNVFIPADQPVSEEIIWEVKVPETKILKHWEPM